MKANAIRKLTFLRMMGYEFSWANFATIEVMSSHRFGHKRVGYLAAAQSFNEETDVILLTTNLLKKEFTSSNIYEVGLAINCLSNIVTPDLARELLPDLTLLTQHSSCYVRKKAVLCLFKLFMKYPQGLRLTFDRVKQCLEDTEPAVVSCAVNVITELADKNPKNYLVMAPHFFSLLTSSSNNWMLIKVVKLLGSLVSEEPRLARKLLDPLASIVKNTMAKSLLYEAVYTLTLALPYCKKADGSIPKSLPGIVDLCGEKLEGFVEEADQNLKYLGLVGFVSLMKSYPKTVVKRRNLILRCLCDDDVTIRCRALELLTGMVTKKNLQELVDQLMRHVHLSEGTYRDELVQKIIFMCSRDKYSYLVDFKWYVTVLVSMSELHGTEHGKIISRQIMDVAIRVFPVREFCVNGMIKILLNSNVVMGKSKDTIWEVLHAAAWVVGEYSNFIEALSSSHDPLPYGLYHSLLAVLLSPTSLWLPSRTQAVYIQSAIKIFASATSSASTSSEELVMCLEIMEENLPLWMESEEVEVQERSHSCYRLLSSLGLLKKLDEDAVEAPLSSFSGAANDVAPAAGEGLGNAEGAGADSVSSPSLPHSSERKPETDLLGLVMLTTSNAPVISPNSQPSAVIDSSSGGHQNGGSFGKFVDGKLAEKCRSSSDVLMAVCIPDPMKPVNAKAQKRVPPPDSNEYKGGLNVELYNDLLALDSSTVGKRKLAIEEVYFGFFGASRRRVQLQQSPSFSKASDDDNVADAQPASTSKLSDSSSSFRQYSGHQGGMDKVDGTPFYLTDRGAEDIGGGDAGHSNFREIQLGAIDSDEEGGVVSKRGKKKKKKDKDKKKKDKKMKKKKKKNVWEERETGDSLAMKADAMSIFGGDVTVYRSDDESSDKLDSAEEEDDDGRGEPRNGIKEGEEFEGLAKVDLTIPLAPDEVMPERKHREVPEYDVGLKEGGEEIEEEQSKKKKSKKKKRKGEKDKKGKGRNKDSGGGGAVGDLLDLGGEPSDEIVQSQTNQGQSSASQLDGFEREFLEPVKGGQSIGSEVGLSPEENATLDSIMTELSNGEWFEHSLKLKSEGQLGRDAVEQVGKILNAKVVGGDSIDSNGSKGTLAAKTSRGKRLRVLLKCQGNVAKVWVKSDSKSTAKLIYKKLKSIKL